MNAYTKYSNLLIPHLATLLKRLHGKKLITDSNNRIEIGTVLK